MVRSVAQICQRKAVAAKVLYVAAFQFAYCLIMSSLTSFWEGRRGKVWIRFGYCFMARFILLVKVRDVDIGILPCGTIMTMHAFRHSLFPACQDSATSDKKKL